MGDMDKITLYEEYRLIERDESEINGTWKGAHLLLFFLAFVFGCSCTFSFHILMYLFDEKCVLFPKLLSLKEMRQSIIYDFMPTRSEESLPVDFVSTQWSETSTCYLPTYVPLLSGICGLVWTTMFLMCSFGNSTMTGLQRPWRILPPILLFSLAMGGLSVYTSYVTHSGLQDLCEKLSEITGSKTCAYAVNIVTLAYERRIRGVYQATRLTILTAWMHTLCWLLAAAVALARMLLVIDFRLVRIQAELQGNIEKMLEHHEQHIRTVFPETSKKDDSAASARTKTAATGTSTSGPKIAGGGSPIIFGNIKPHSSKRRASTESVKVRFVNKNFNTDSETKIDMDGLQNIPRPRPSLVPQESQRLAQLKIYRSVKKEHRFIAKIIFDLVHNAVSPLASPESGYSLFSYTKDSLTSIRRQQRKGRSANQESLTSSSSSSFQTILHPESSAANRAATRTSASSVTDQTQGSTRSLPLPPSSTTTRERKSSHSMKSRQIDKIVSKYREGKQQFRSFTRQSMVKDKTRETKSSDKRVKDIESASAVRDPNPDVAVLESPVSIAGASISAVILTGPDQAKDKSHAKNRTAETSAKKVDSKEGAVVHAKIATPEESVITLRAGDSRRLDEVSSGKTLTPAAEDETTIQFIDYTGDIDTKTDVAKPSQSPEQVLHDQAEPGPSSSHTQSERPKRTHIKEKQD